MGKKSRRDRASKAPAEPAASPPNSLPPDVCLDPSWQHGQDALSRATPEEVLKLPLCQLHRWHCLKHEANGITSLIIMDVTPALPERVVGACLFIDPHSRQEDLVKAIFAAMINPLGSYEVDKPRRPSVIVMEPEFEPAFAYVKEKVAAVGVSVEMNCGDVDVSQMMEFCERVSLSALIQTCRKDPGTTSHPDCTWHDGVRMGATVANVKKLPQNSKATWKCSGYYDEENDRHMLFLEDLQRGMSRTSPPIGIGQCNKNDKADITQGILASMLAPSQSSDRGRPGRIVLNSSLKDSFDYIQKNLKEANVQVKLDDQCAACGRADSRESPFLSCGKCRKVLYCGRDCQQAHWKTHKKECGKKV